MPERQLSPIDRGYVVMRPDSPATRLVLICAAVDGAGNPSGAYAVHRKVTNLSIAPGIRWHRSGTVQWSAQMLETYREIGTKTVYIRPVTNARALAAMVSPG